jgi:hypothetical protein
MTGGPASTSLLWFTSLFDLDALLLEQPESKIVKMNKKIVEIENNLITGIIFVNVFIPYNNIKYIETVNLFRIFHKFVRPNLTES